MRVDTVNSTTYNNKECARCPLEPPSATAVTQPLDSDTFSWIWSAIGAVFGIVSGLISSAFFVGSLKTRVDNLEHLAREVKDEIRTDLRDLRHDVGALRDAMLRKRDV